MPLCHLPALLASSLSWPALHHYPTSVAEGVSEPFIGSASPCFGRVPLALTVGDNDIGWWWRCSVPRQTPWIDQRRL